MCEFKILPKIKSPKDLKGLSLIEVLRLRNEIREMIISSVSKNGGHLSSNLGVVELTIAMHLAFDLPTDQIVFDVSHQSYTHKLLTGRYEGFSSIRTKGGLSGYCNIEESEYDAFGAGHASTSISAALGLRTAKDLKGESGEVVCVIGDGALTGGMSFEALNHLGHIDKKLIIIINDNERSISENVGAMTKVLNDLRTSKEYRGIKRSLSDSLPKIPLIGNFTKNVLIKAKSALKQAVVPGMFFENLGLTYIGIIDGHDVEDLIHGFKIAKEVDGPIVLHVATQKGRGYVPALENPGTYHGVSSFSVKDGVKREKEDKSYSDVFGEKIIDLANKDGDVCAITAAMSIGSGLCGFRKTFPDRFFDVGIAEAHAMTMAAGMARNGLKPYFAVYSTFMQRAYDQLIHDVCLQNLPVRICLDRAGVVGADGPTHHGVFDMPLLLAIPGIEILSPATHEELEYSMDYSLGVDSPLIIRYPRAKAISIDDLKEPTLEPVISDEDAEVLVVCFGSLTENAISSVKKLKSIGYKAGFLKFLRLKPIDCSRISKLISKTTLIVTVEDSQVSNGFGAYFETAIRKEGVSSRFLHLGYPDEFIHHGSISEINRDLGLDSEGLTKSIILELDSM